MRPIDIYGFSTIFVVMTDLGTINLVLDILVKAVFLVVFVFAIIVLRKLDDVIESAERSAESLEHTAETVERLVDIANFIPFIGPKRKKARPEKEDEELDEEEDDKDE